MFCLRGGLCGLVLRYDTTTTQFKGDAITRIVKRPLCVKNGNRIQNTHDLAIVPSIGVAKRTISLTIIMDIF